jgi:hypothetical protein
LDEGGLYLILSRNIPMKREKIVTLWVKDSLVAGAGCSPGAVQGKIYSVED